MRTHSIFAREWWTVCLTSSLAKTSSPTNIMNHVATQVAAIVGWSLHKTPNLLRSGAFLTSVKEEKLDDSGNWAIAGVLMIHTQRRYFPVSLQGIETGPIAWEEIRSTNRDFPRSLNSELLQYPLILGCFRATRNIAIVTLSSPYFMMLKEIVSNLNVGKLFSDCLALAVERTFDELASPKSINGEISVRSGRMVITGINYVRSAEFTGDNVIASPLYLELREKDGITVVPKACRLGRTYERPVGGSRRRFVCWFDQHGNFRFAPGFEMASATHKLIELMSFLYHEGLLEAAETRNPLTKIGWNS